MMEQIKADKIRKAKNAARRLKFHNTRLMIEGLAKQLEDFTHRSEQTTPRKAKRIFDKIACIESTMENELQSVDKSKVNKKAFSTIISNIAASIFFNALPALFFVILPDLVKYQNQKVASIFKLIVITFFSINIVREVKNIFKDITDYTYDGMKRNIEQLCNFTHGYVSRAVDDVRDSLEDVPPL